MNDQDILDISGLIHRKWSASFKILELAKNETNDGSPDWNEFHELRLESAIKEEKKWNDFNNRFIAEHRTILNRIFGI